MTTPPGPAPVLAPQPLGRTDDLAERGRARVFDVRLWRQPARAFVLRFGGRLVGYVNRCAHVPAELDWQPGEFLDDAREFIVCAMHGATYDPADGRCLGGPCGRARLIALCIDERDGHAHWFPTPDVQPVPPDPAPAAP